MSMSIHFRRADGSSGRPKKTISGARANGTTIMLEGKAAEIHEKLWKDWTTLKWSLDSYKDLFSELDARQTIDPFGGDLFHLYICPRLWDDLILRLSRLTDPPATGSKTNVSVERLLEFCDDDDELRADIENALKKAEKATDSARVVRNKRIAHADEKQALEGSGIGPQSVNDISDATDAIYEVLQKFDLRRLGIHMMNEVVHPMDANRFIVMLERAGHAVRYISEFLTDADDFDRFDERKAKLFVENLGREYNPMVDMMHLMGIWKLGKRLPSSR